MEHEPGRAFLILGTLTALVLLVATPPFQVPDEGAHFFRAYALSEGRLSGTRQEGRPGIVVPKSLLAISRAWSQKVPFHPEARLDLDRGLQTFGIALEPERTRFKPLADAIVVIAYPPVAYVPQALGIAVGRVLEASPIVLFHLGRLANAAAAICVCWLAIQIAPFGQWPLALLMLTPIASFLRSSMSADAVTLSLVFANLSAGLAIATAKTRPAAKLVRTYAATTVLLLLCKYAYFWVPLAILTGLGGNQRPRDLLRWLAIPGLAGGALVLAWYARVWDIATPIAPGSDPSGQLAVIAADAFAHGALLGEHLAATFSTHYRGLVGTLGWLDTPLPLWFVHLYWIVLGGLTLAQGVPLPVCRERGVLLGLGVVGYLVIVNTLFLTMPMAAQGMRGMQARYVIPVTPFLVLAALGALPWRLPMRWTAASCWVLAIVSVAVTGATLGLRYYGPP